MDYPADSLGGYLPTFYINWIKKNTHTSTGILVNYPEAFLGGYLPTFYITLIFKTVKSRRHTSTGIYVDYTEGYFGGYLPIFYINWSFKNRQKPQTYKQSHLVNYQGAPWVATYLHFILTEFSKTAKSSRHTSTGILVNYSEVFLSGYLPTFYIHCIFKNRQKPWTHKHRHFSQLPKGFLGLLPTYILY